MSGRRRILLVDDEVGVTRLLKLSLEATGDYQVRVENSGKAGLLAAQQFRPDVILLDVLMPDMTGHEVLERLEEDAVLRDIPVLYLTATLPRERGAAGGRNERVRPWIAKPVRASDVIEEIERELERRRLA